MGILLILQKSCQQPCQGAVYASPHSCGHSTSNRRRKPHQTTLVHASPGAGTGGSRAPAHPWPAWLKQVPAIFMSKLWFTSDLLLSSKREAVTAMPPGSQCDVLCSQLTGGEGEATPEEGGCDHGPKCLVGCRNVLQEWAALTAINQQLPDAA